MTWTRTLYTFVTGNAATRGNVIALARSKLREKTGDSYDTTDLNSFFLSVYRDRWAIDLQWPEAAWEDTTVADQDLYSLPGDLGSIFRVYVNGNRVAPTTIALLEGEARRIFDETWRRLPSITLPDATTRMPTGGLPITAGPFQRGKRMLYFVRGGQLGLVPPPAAAYPIRIEGFAIPDTPANDTADLVFPKQFEEGLAAGVAMLTLISDDKPELAASLNTLHENALALAKKWRRSLQRDLQQVVQPYDYRGYWGR